MQQVQMYIFQNMTLLHTKLNCRFTEIMRNLYGTNEESNFLKNARDGVIIPI